MKTLYVSDLDGTLFNDNGVVSDYTTSTLNKLIADGLNFTISTARLGASLPLKLGTVDWLFPLSVMQGGSLFDIKTRIYTPLYLFSQNEIDEILVTSAGKDIKMYFFGIVDGLLKVLHTHDSAKISSYFYSKWTNLGVCFEKVDDPKKLLDYDITYCRGLGYIEDMLSISTEINATESLEAYAFDSNYAHGIFNLGIKGLNVTKADTISIYREKYCFDKVIGFGDTMNDYPLCTACDEFYVPITGDEELKTHATGIIESNDEDSVVKFLLNRHNQG